MLNTQNPETLQILQLHQQGATPEQIAQALGKDPVAISLLLRSQIDCNRKLTLEERYGDLKSIAIDVLKDVAQFGENESARVTAAKVLLDEFDGNNGHGGLAGKIDYDQMAERIAIARQRVDAVRNKQLDEIAKIPVIMPSVSIKQDVEFEEVQTGAI